MHYLALARKYRPKCFADLIGQEVLTKVLQYSIQNNQLASSFLFTGIRGIGKTTAARIIAQTINCTNLHVKDEVIKACQKCENCLEFNAQSHPDITEIDAASYTSVDNVREIIEKALYRPVLAKYKVFIIDEVHMLSKSAFNALLKTLEEPPAHVVFMLLTTEITKVPITILSRCQKFNLKRFGIKDLIFLLEKVCHNENIACDLNAIQAVAYRADGSARDALTLLEQVGFLAKQKGSKITLEIVEEGLDLNNAKHAVELLDLIFAKDCNGAVELASRLYQENFDFTNIITRLIELVALLSKVKLIPGYHFAEFILYEKQLQKLLEQTDMAFLTSLWQLFDKGLFDVGRSLNQLVAFEMLIIKAIYCSLMPSPKDLALMLKDAPIIVAQQSHIPESVITKTHQPELTKLDIAKNNTYVDEIKHKDQDRPKDSSAEVALVETGQIDQDLLFRFIKYIHDQHLFSLYHLMMNECGVVKFEHGIIKLEVAKNIEEIKSQLLEALKACTGEQNWQFSQVINAQFTSLHNKLKDKAAKALQISSIQAVFPQAVISDIWFNFLAK